MAKLKYKIIEKIIVIFMVAIMLSGCSNNENLDNILPALEGNNLPTTEDNKELSGKLTVSTVFDGYIDIFAEEFMDMHPNVEIIVERPDDNKVSYMYRIAIDLLSGTASDLIDLSGLDINHKAQSGLLVNIYDYMNNDPDFDKSDYYTNIFEAMEFEDGLYAMPLSFNYDMVYISKPLAENIGLDYENYKNINYTEMLDIYEKVKKTHPSPDKFYLMPGVTKSSFFDYESVDFFDIETGDASFDSDEFLQHLKFTKKLNTVYHPETMEWDFTRVGVRNEDFLIEDFIFSKFTTSNIDMKNMMVEFENTINPIPFLSSKGKAPFSNLLSTYAISNNSKNKELAWEFLKYCASAKELPAFESEEDEEKYSFMFLGNIPINIENFYTYFRHSFESEVKWYEERGLEGNWKFKNEEEKEKMFEDTLNQIHEWNQERNVLVGNLELTHLLREELDNYYYYDLATAEETAKIIQNKVFTYLNE
ncbi:extracellular solute-binding protein [Tissierella carlieri]|jgi:multiple sugar transport system substrate-binding protein|uniref:ABC transporter substrate-binding protein n=1 Tax=Tissierella carlieri TaxID=689904 RepID=UPI001C10791F|nr:extracellular solute-binding protein [Tissierella carlieri]MBU5314533.1 extracellular solute-binding protein [Tissierella carlieri]